MLFHPLFSSYLGWVWKKIEVQASRPDPESSESVRLPQIQMCFGPDNSSCKFPLDFKLACDINTGRMHCSICWLQLESKALALTCKTLNVLELLVWDIISFLCHIAIHEITRDAQSWRGLSMNQMSAENLPLWGPQYLELAPHLHPLMPCFVKLSSNLQSLTRNLWAKVGLLWVFCMFCDFFAWLFFN